MLSTMYWMKWWVWKQWWYKQTKQRKFHIFIPHWTKIIFFDLDPALIWSSYNTQELIYRMRAVTEKDAKMKEVLSFRKCENEGGLKLRKCKNEGVLKFWKMQKWRWFYILENVKMRLKKRCKKGGGADWTGCWHIIFITQTENILQLQWKY